MEKISVIIKEPGKNPRHVNISPTLKNLQNIVSGYIETFTFAEGACIICNEEGAIEGFPYNTAVAGADFYGTIIFVGTKAEEFADFPMAWKNFKTVFAHCFDENE